MTVNQTFIDIVQNISKQRIALAGYRLADMFMATAPKMPRPRPVSSTNGATVSANTATIAVAVAAAFFAILSIVLAVRLKNATRSTVGYSSVQTDY